MLDFLKVSHALNKKVIEIFPKFIIGRSKDLMIRGGDFYAIWNEETGMWSKDEQVAINLIDHELDLYYKEHKDEFDSPVRVLHMWDADTGMADKWHKYVQKQCRDSYHALDEKLIFLNDKTTREDYASRKLSYPLEPVDISSYDNLMNVLYNPEERHKIEWAIGAVVSGDSKDIQKFLVFYGAPGTGKSTILNIIQDLFQGYYSVFDAKALGSTTNVFALEAFKNNPLVAIQQDGDLSKIEDNTRLNSVVSHDLMTVNEKYKSVYENKFNAFLFMGTNKPVRITDSKSGIIRRLIDVSPSGRKMSKQLYSTTIARIKFELGGIACRCLEVYRENPGAYDDYIPISMLGASNDFYNFVLDHYDILGKEGGVTLNTAWENYNQYCKDANIPYPYSKRIFKEELKSYFDEFIERSYDENGTRVRNLYKGFKEDKFEYQSVNKPVTVNKSLRFEDEVSILDQIFSDYKAQYASEEGTPLNKWDDVKTTLKDINTHELHYVRVPKNHIVIDFDIKDEQGNKCLKKNIEAAMKFPLTYGELSKSGQGIHLHYIYNGDASKLARIYDDNIEIKVFTGKSSLRRKLTKCNNLPIATISSNLPMKGEKVVNFDTVQSEKGLRALVEKNLRKEIHPATKPSIDFILKILDDAYASGMKYDISDLRPAVLAFAANSSHQPGYCVKTVGKMKFKSEEASEAKDYEKDILAFFDVEVFPNLFVVVYKVESQEPIKLINPNPQDIEELVKYKLVGFNCRRYDNHILYARMLGYSNQELYELSQRIINGSKNAMFGEAYNISYTDIYDFSSKKQSLKKFEIELGIHHQELNIPWDKPVDEKLWPTVAGYCVNDVIATEAVFYARKDDFIAREILADIAGGTPNDTTNQLTTKIIFGDEKHPQDKFIYTDLSEMFEGYSFDNGVSSYRGENPGEGGYVYSEPGIYTNVALLDVASMHPTSIEQLNLFGPYTKNFSDIKSARIAIKHGEYDIAGEMFNGKLKKHLKNAEAAKSLAYALKIAINSVYGLTSAKFDNKCRDPRNIDNIVAKRGSLFMIDLKYAVQEKGFTVAHIKTDSIKIPNATPEIIDFVMEFGKKYGYIFEHEATYERMCLVNDAVYIAKYKDGPWTATGTQFQVPYVFKKLFSKEDILFEDLCETKSVTTSLYLDMNENLPDVSDYEKIFAKTKDESLLTEIEKGHNYIFVGKVGSFCPIKPGCGGGLLVREKDGRYYSATGAKDYRWLEAELVKNLGKEKDIDLSYYNKLVDEAIASIEEYGDFEWFASV